MVVVAVEGLLHTTMTVTHRASDRVHAPTNV